MKSEFSFAPTPLCIGIYTTQRAKNSLTEKRRPVKNFPNRVAPTGPFIVAWGKFNRALASVERRPR